MNNMKKHTQRTRLSFRITATVMSLLLSFSAASCAVSDELNVSAPYTEVQPPESMVSVISELSSLSNPKIDSGETVSSGYITPIYPEESETTLELVKTYPLGQDKGGIPFYLEYDMDLNCAEIHLAGAFFLAKDGSLYARTDSYFINVDTGETIEIPDCRFVYSAFADRSGNFYAFTPDYAIRFTAEQGVEDCHALPGSGSRYEFFLNRYDSPTLERSDGFYTFDGERTTVSNYTVEQVSLSEELPANLQGLPDISGHTKDTVAVLSISGKHYVVDPAISIQCESEAGILVLEYSSYFYSMVGSASDCLYTRYSYDGDPIAKLKVSTTSSFQEKEPCEVHAGQATCHEYIPETVTIGTTTFEHVLGRFMLTDPDGNLYILLIYPDKANLYKIHAGYSDVSLTDFSKVEEPIKPNHT